MALCALIVCVVAARQGPRGGRSYNDSYLWRTTHQYLDDEQLNFLDEVSEILSTAEQRFEDVTGEERITSMELPVCANALIMDLIRELRSLPQDVVEKRTEPVMNLVYALGTRDPAFTHRPVRPPHSTKKRFKSEEKLAHSCIKDNVDALILPTLMRLVESSPPKGAPSSALSLFRSYAETLISIILVSLANASHDPKWAHRASEAFQKLIELDSSASADSCMISWLQVLLWYAISAPSMDFWACAYLYDLHWNFAVLPLNPLHSHTALLFADVRGEDFSAENAAQMRMLLRETKRVLTLFVATGQLRQFVPVKSTLLSLLRYGDIWNEFSSKRAHCVDIDLEIEILCTKEQWFEVAYALDALFHDFPGRGSARSFRQCSWTFAGEGLVKQQRPELDSIICYFEFDRVLTVELRRSPLSGPSVDDTDESANEQLTMCRTAPLADEIPDNTFPCPSSKRTMELLHAYGPCAAVPNINKPQMACVPRILWMRGNFTRGDLAMLEHRWRVLSNLGYNSMWPLWNRDQSCAQWRSRLIENSDMSAPLYIGSFTWE